MKALVRRYPTIHRRVAPAYNTLLDGYDFVLRRDQDLPPRRLRFVGNGDFRQVGQSFLRYSIDLAGLEPHHRVLDVGCGIGRMALPLSSYIGSGGSYEGFDIVPHGVEWCQRHITASHPQFRFQLADIHNDEYNPAGVQSADAYTFPYDDDEFDFALLTSVFTHMLPHEVENYLVELARVLKPGGACLITYFLMSDETRRLEEEGVALTRFSVEADGYHTTNLAVPEEAVAYQESTIECLHAQVGLPIETVHYGAWSGRSEHLSGQDVCIARKPDNGSFGARVSPQSG